MSLRETVLIGRITTDITVKNMPSGQTVAEFSLAVDDEYHNKNNKTHWHQCKAWNKLSKIAGDYLKKGQEICLVGRISLGEYIKSDTNEHKAYLNLDVDRIVFLQQNWKKEKKDKEDDTPF